MNEKVVLSVCVGSNCSSKGNTLLSSKLKKYLKEKDLNQQVKIKFQPCSDYCEDGPLVVLEGEHLFQKSLEDLKGIIEIKTNQ